MERNVMAWLAAVLGITTCAVAVAFGPGEACFVAPVGGANRSVGCVAVPGCVTANPPCAGTCQVGSSTFAVVSCDSLAESAYWYCSDFPATCAPTGTSTSCLTGNAYYQAANCTLLSCAVNIPQLDCTTVY